MSVKIMEAVDRFLVVFTTYGEAKAFMKGIEFAEDKTSYKVTSRRRINGKHVITLEETRK